MNEKLARRIAEIDDSELIKFCNDIYSWRTSGVLDQKSVFYKRFDAMKGIFNDDIRLFEEKVLDKAHERFHNIVKLLFTDKLTWYIEK